MREPTGTQSLDFRGRNHHRLERRVVRVANDGDLTSDQDSQHADSPSALGRATEERKEAHKRLANLAQNHIDNAPGGVDINSSPTRRGEQGKGH
ncbi:hypothetical protein FRB91_005475 [Serendipita sp. 411]|nr:hypothetical protein FRB91_005475 [Serendipita sp. 411]